MADDVTRRDAIKLAASAGVVAAVGATAVAAEDEVKEDKIASSGNTASQPRTTEQKLDAAQSQSRMLAGGLATFFSRISPDSAPGRNTLTISGLPAGTRVISVWMTEWAQGNRPHAGGAVFSTSSVQLYNNGTQCRVIFNQDWNHYLPAACQVIYGSA